MAWLRCRAAVRALQCHFLAGSVTAEQPLMFRCSSSSSCWWEPPQNGSSSRTLGEGLRLGLVEGLEVRLEAIIRSANCSQEFKSSSKN